MTSIIFAIRYISFFFGRCSFVRNHIQWNDNKKVFVHSWESVRVGGDAKVFSVSFRYFHQEEYWPQYSWAVPNSTPRGHADQQQTSMFLPNNENLREMKYFPHFSTIHTCTSRQQFEKLPSFIHERGRLSSQIKKYKKYKHVLLNCIKWQATEIVVSSK